MRGCVRVAGDARQTGNRDATVLKPLAPVLGALKLKKAYSWTAACILCLYFVGTEVGAAAGCESPVCVVIASAIHLGN